MKTITFTIAGMTCGGCVNSVKKALQAVEGVLTVNVSLTDNNAKVGYDDAQIHPGKLKHAIQDAGYEVTYQQGD